jgi:hypothetical protein
MPNNNTKCRHKAPCGAACVGDGAVKHTIHTCMDKDCPSCHDGKVHVDAMLARRKAAAQQGKRNDPQA